MGGGLVKVSVIDWNCDILLDANLYYYIFTIFNTVCDFFLLCILAVTMTIFNYRSLLSTAEYTNSGANKWLL